MEINCVSPSFEHAKSVPKVVSVRTTKHTLRFRKNINLQKMLCEMFVNDQKSKQVDLRLIKELVRSKFDLSLYTYKESIYSLTERVLLP